MIRICALLVAVGCFTMVPGTSQAAPRPNPKLIKKVTLKWEDQPVVEGIVKEIEAIGMKISVDMAALEAEGIEGARDTLELNSVPLFPALQRIASLHGMYLLSNGMEVRIVSHIKGEDGLFNVTYSLKGIQGALTSEAELADAIHVTSTIDAGWLNGGTGEGEVLAITPTSISISQTAIGHDEMVVFFSEVERALSGRAPTYFDPRTQLLLKKKFQFASAEMSLEEQVQALLQGVNFLIDRKSLSDEKIELSTTSVPPAGTDTVLNHLSALCAASQLDWYVRDGLLILQSKVDAKNTIELRAYNVRKHITPELTPFLMAAKLTNTPELGPWLEQETGGALCTPMGPLLILLHTRVGHEKIAELVK
ncbi:MAG: hypothetical protein R3C18_22095 [Planctomycetaceae bacterium]